MVESSLRTPARVSIITGTVATGKTEELVRRIAALLEDGASPGAIGVFAATPDAAAALQVRLDTACDGAAPEVQTPLAFELRLLATPEARNATGCEARAMLRFEENIFLEDMKTGGVQPRRLAKMLEFLYRSACDLEPMDRTWFYNDEEEKTFVLLEQMQRYYGAYVRPMIPFAAYRFVRDFPKVAGALAYDHVFVDDCQLLTKASQVVLGASARETLTVAGDRFAKVTAGEAYPFAAGLAELAEANPEAETVELSRSFASYEVTDAINLLLEDEALGGLGRVSASQASGSYRLVDYPTPHDELAGVTETVASLVASGFSPAEIAVAAPRGSWERNLTKALIGADILVSPKRRPDVSGDVRTLEGSFEGRVVTLLKLAANPNDRLALRCWCGFGDYLANSALFCGMAKADVRVELGTMDISTTGEADALFVAQRERILASLAEARKLLPELRGLRGWELLEQAAKLVGGNRSLSPALLGAFGPLDSTMDAAALIAALEQHVLFPRFAGEGVRVGLLGDFAGLRPRVMVVAGLVNGLVPSREYFDPTVIERNRRPALLAAESAKTYAACGKADERLFLTYFSAAPLAEAEQAKLKVERVRLLQGVRMCETQPSETIRALSGVYFHD